MVVVWRDISPDYISEIVLTTFNSCNNVDIKEVISGCVIVKSCYIV